MATRRKGVVNAVNDAINNPWQAGETVEMSNGMKVTRWEHVESGEVRLVPAGLHPDDQPLTEPALPMVAPDPDIEETATDRVSAMLAQASGYDRAEVNVYRMNNGAREYCRKFRPDEFEDGSFDMLREMFGPGEYELRLYSTDPVTRKFSVRNLTRIKISDVKTPARAELPSGLSQVLSTIAQGQQQMLQALVDIKSAPAKDPMEEMSRMLTMMSAMREAMGLNQQPQGREKSSIGEIVSAIRELRGAAEELTPQTEKEPESLIGMLPKVLELVKSGQQAQQGIDPGLGGMIPQADPGAVLSPVTIPPSMIPTPANSTPEDEPVKLTTAFKLRAYLRALVDMAKNKDPVSKAAQFVYEKLPDDLLDMMELPAWFDMLASVAPEVRDHRDYITEVRNAALALLNQPEDDEPKAA